MVFRCHVLQKVLSSALLSWAGRQTCLTAFLKSLGWNLGDSERWPLGCHLHSWAKGSLVLVRALAFWALPESSRWSRAPWAHSGLVPNDLRDLHKRTSLAGL